VLPTRTLAGQRTSGMVVAVEGSATSRDSAGTAAAPRGGGPGEEGMPDEVTPQRTKQRVAAVTKAKPTRRLQPGDLVCGQCGEGNAPTRKFCSRCGEELTEAEVVKAKWYRPLMFWRRSPKTMDAGTRPGQAGAKRDPRASSWAAYRKFRAVLASVLLVLGLLYVVVAPLRDGINRVLETPVTWVKTTVTGWWEALTDDYVDQAPVRRRGSAALPRHPAKAAFDGNTETFWAARWTPAKRPSLTVGFDHSVTLSYVVVHAGAAGESADKFLQPAVLRFTYGSGNFETHELEFSGDPQDVKLTDATTFRKLTITVMRVHPREGVRNVAIKEIEFKSRK
jgi:hypothetical protein